MLNAGLVQVSLDKDLIKKLLDGLYSGADGRALKVIIDADGQYHISSKGLAIVVEVNAAGTGVSGIKVSNEKLYANISQKELADRNLESSAASVYFVLRDKYSPYFHSLADNIVVFSRAYHNPSIDEH